MTYALPLMFVLGLWWASTALLLYRTGRDAATFRMTLAWVSAMAVVGAIAIVGSRNMESALGAYLAFSGALAIWALHETSYLLGFVTGPRAESCPEHVGSLGRFWYGVQASLYHELAIVITAVAIVAVTWNSPNVVAALTFIVFWIMRWSTKLNIFLGVRNLHQEFWPVHLQYLRSYAREKTMNRLFPWSILAAAVAIGFFVMIALDTATSAVQRTGATLLVGILVLGTLEHLFLMMKIPDDRLWRIATRSRQQAG